MGKIDTMSMGMKHIGLTQNELDNIIKALHEDMPKHQALLKVLINYIKTHASDKETILTVGSMLLISAEKLKGNTQALSEAFVGASFEDIEKKYYGGMPGSGLNP